MVKRINLNISFENYILKLKLHRNCKKGTKLKLQANREDFSYDPIDANWRGLFLKEKNEFSYKFLEFLTKETNEYPYKKLVEEFKYNFENAKKIGIKLFPKEKIERIKILEKVGRPYFKYWK